MTTKIEIPNAIESLQMKYSETLGALCFCLWNGFCWLRVSPLPEWLLWILRATTWPFMCVYSMSPKIFRCLNISTDYLWLIAVQIINCIAHCFGRNLSNLSLFLCFFGWSSLTSKCLHSIRLLGNLILIFIFISFHRLSSNQSYRYFHFHSNVRCVRKWPKKSGALFYSH